jgi:hypothetical protein
VARHPRRLVIVGLSVVAAAAAAFEAKLLWVWRDCRRPDVQSYPKSYPMCTHVLDVARLHMAGWTVLALVVPLAAAGFVWASATPSIDPSAYRRRRR